MTDPLTEALARLRAEVEEAEAHLARLTDDDALLGEQLALAGSTYTARLRVAEVEHALPGAAHEHRAVTFADALSSLLAPQEEPGEESSTDKPDDAEHPLSGLFA